MAIKQIARTANGVVLRSTAASDDIMGLTADLLRRAVAHRWGNGLDKSASQPRGSSLTRKDWIDAAIEVLIDTSIEQVRIDRLCRTLKVTKGSFYWHFKNRDDLVAAILEQWKTDAIEGLQSDIEYGIHSSADSLRILLGLTISSKVTRRAADLEIAILGWARRSPAALAALSEINTLRTAKLFELLLQVGVDEAEAHFRAHQTHACIRYIGQRIDLSVAERTEMARQFFAFLGIS